MAANLEDEEKGILRVVQMEGTQTPNEIADYNKDVGRICNYCLEAVSTSDHVRWECKHVDATRKEIDPELADIPHRLLPNYVKNGIAPAMKTEGRNTFWGAKLGEDLNNENRKLLDENLALHTPGSDARKTEERQAALEINEDPEVAGYNARQIMLKYKEAHGSGQDLDSPGAEEIERNMEGYPEGHKADIYGDGSHTSLTVWWAALGGHGIRVPDWNKGGEQSEDRETTSYHGAAIGQTGTSTRQELTAWVRVLALPCRSMYATDTVSMLSKALKLIKAGEKDQKGKDQSTKVRRGNPFGKPWAAGRRRPVGTSVDSGQEKRNWKPIASESKRPCY